MIDQEFPSLSSNFYKKRFKPQSNPLPAYIHPESQEKGRFYNNHKKAVGESFKQLEHGNCSALKNGEKALESSKFPPFGGSSELQSDAEIAASSAAEDKHPKPVHKIKFESAGPIKFINSKKDNQKPNNSPEKLD